MQLNPHKRLVSLLLLAGTCALIACGGGRDGNGDPNGDTASNGGNNGDDDDDDDARPPPGLSCDPAFDTSAPGGTASGACVTDLISCGQVVQGNNEGGSSTYHASPGGPFSQCAGSASQTSRLDGPERVYELVLPAGTRALHAYLKSCQKSWLFWHQNEEACPDSTFFSCGYAYNGSFYDQDGELLIGEEVDRVYFVVEGDNGVAGNFELRVDCYN